MEKTEELLAMVQDINSFNGGMPHLDVFEMYSFNDIMNSFGFDPMDIALKTYNGDFYPNDDYFSFNGYGNLESFSSYDLEKELLEYENEIRETYKETFE